MVDVLINMELHLNVAKGYLRTGMTVDLDGFQDQEIVRVRFGQSSGCVPK